MWDAADFDDYAAEIRGLQDQGGKGGASTAGGWTLERLVLACSLLCGTGEDQSRMLETLGGVGGKRITPNRDVTDYANSSTSADSRADIESGLEQWASAFNPDGRGSNGIVPQQ